MDINQFRKFLKNTSPRKTISEAQADVPGDIAKLIQGLEKVRGVESVDINDRWNDGWFSLVVTLKVDNTIQFTPKKNAPMIKVNVIPLYRYVERDLKDEVKKSGLRMVGFQELEKKHEYISPFHYSMGKEKLPVRSGFVGNQITIEVYSKE